MPLRKLKHQDHIHERISADGRLTGYLVKIRRKGFPHYVKTFDSLEAAKSAARRVLNDHDDGNRRDRLAATRVTLGDIIQQAIEKREKESCEIKGKASELYRLKAFKRNERNLCQTSLAGLGFTEFDDWKERRLEEVSRGTVLRELRLLRPILNDAVPTYHLVVSPLHFVKNPTVQDERTARFEPGEKQVLFQVINASTNIWLAACAEFALETSCRRSEMLTATWDNFDPLKGTIWLPDSKNGRGRHLLLSLRAQEIVEGLPFRGKGGRIFKIDAETLKTAYEKCRVAAAKIIGRLAEWRWHDFRHEAISRAFDAGWTEAQVMDLSGHVDVKSLLRYRHPDPAIGVKRVRATEAARKSAPALRVVA